MKFGVWFMGANYTVYMHTAPNGKVYIGITSVEPTKRWDSGHGYKKCQRFFYAIRKYGWGNIKHEILHTGLTKEEAENKEIELIKLFNSTNPEKGYNIANGGNCPGTHSEETKRKIGAAHKGKIVSDATRQKMRENHADNSGEKNFWYGKHLPESTRRKISESRIGNEWAIRKSVIQYDLDGVYINTYKSMAEAHRKTGVSTAGISQCCNGIQKQAGGYVWRVKDEQRSDNTGL